MQRCWEFGSLPATVAFALNLSIVTETASNRDIRSLLEPFEKAHVCNMWSGNYLPRYQLRGKTRRNQLRARKTYSSLLVPFERAVSTHEIQRLIGQQPKAQYDLAEPIPDRLVELLRQLAQWMNERESQNRWVQKFGSRLVPDLLVRRTVLSFQMAL